MSAIPAPLQRCRPKWRDVERIGRCGGDRFGALGGTSQTGGRRVLVAVGTGERHVDLGAAGVADDPQLIGDGRDDGEADAEAGAVASRDDPAAGVADDDCGSPSCTSAVTVKSPVVVA